MWNNFKSMPIFLKFLTGHAAVCLVLFIFLLIPGNQFSTDDQHTVPYAEWWSNGVWPLLTFAALAIGIGGMLFLKKYRFGRVLFLAGFGGALIAPALLSHDQDDLGASVLCLPFVLLLGLYLFRNREVKAYFVSNDSPEITE